MSIVDVYSILMVALGCGFFIIGSVGLWRFPDLLSRLHALTKADNLGLGLIALGLLPQVGGIMAGIQVVVIWVAVMVSGAVCCYLVASQTSDQQDDSESGG